MNASPEVWLEQLRPVLEMLNQGVIINDETGHILFANVVFLEMLGQSAEEVVGRPVIGLFPTKDVPELLEHIHQREMTGRSRFEFYLPQPGGGQLPVIVTARQVGGPAGCKFSAVTVTDISEQKRAQAKLRHANELLEFRQKQIEEELLLAARVQQSLAPKNLAWGGVAVETFYEPVRTIGGDFGLVGPNQGHLNLLVCDISGHGIGSALIANRVYTETISQIELETDLNSLLLHLNQFAIHNLSSEAFYFTLAVARIDSQARSLQFAGAGHPPAVLVRRGEQPRLLESTNPILGVFENAVDGQITDIPLRSGDRVVLYTDGFSESFTGDREMLGVDGMVEIIEDTAALPLTSMKEQILKRVNNWRGGPAADDMSLILAEVL